MNALSVISLVATVVLFGAAIFLGVQNRADSVKMRERVEALEAQLDGTGVAQQAPAPAPSVESALLAQREQELADLKNELAIQSQENEALDAQFEKIQSQKEQPFTAVQRKIQAAPAIAEVVEFVPDLGFMELNAGSNRQLEPGQEYAIRRDHYVIGRVVIGQSVDVESCIADLLPGSIPPGFTIQPGDQVVQLGDQVAQLIQ